MTAASSAVLVSADQTVFTVDLGPLLASELPGLGEFRVLSYDTQLFRYAAVKAQAALAGRQPGLTVSAEGSTFTFVSGQALLLGDATEGTTDGLAADCRLFGVTVDEDEDGDVRVHLRNGLKGKSKLTRLGELPGTQEQGARTPAGIKSDRLIASVADAGAIEVVAITTQGPSNLILWPDSERVGLGVLTGA